MKPVRGFVHLETTAPYVQTCPRCRRSILYGLAEGIAARVDVVPISGTQEAAAAAAGIQTFTLRRTGLVQRDAIRRTDPALASPVLAEHRCPPQPQQLSLLPAPGGSR
ncbi:hypothetical protein [Winogradskya humida]|nr:hypothetical protein [Actinoplanes humidus]